MYKLCGVPVLDNLFRMFMRGLISAADYENECGAYVGTGHCVIVESTADNVERHYELYTAAEFYEEYARLAERHMEFTVDGVIVRTF